ncbi:hypothetical protein ABXT70_03115 [Candidatus Njordibacter sp. Uisw_039]
MTAKAPPLGNHHYIQLPKPPPINVACEIDNGHGMTLPLQAGVTLLRTSK